VTSERDVPAGQRLILVLDSLFDDLSVESKAAASMGWEVERWDGSDAMLTRTAIAVHVRTRVDVPLLARMPSCRVIGRFGTGLDSVDLVAATQRGIVVMGVRDYCTPELTAHTLGLAFALERQLAAAGRLRLSATATWDEIVRGLPVVGRTRAAVVGFGVIGSAVTRALLAAGFEVLVVTAHAAEAARGLGAQPVDLDEALAAAEMLFLHASLTADTEGLMDRRRIAAMRRDALLIDTARLGLIDEDAVAEALSRGRLGGVALDARLAPHSPLGRLRDDPRLLVTPHVGWYSQRSAEVLRQRTIVDSIAAASHPPSHATEATT